jgi:CxxC motif-containing protein
MKTMICIVCPRGCRLEVGDAPDFPVTGNGCERGVRYARDEMTFPTRTVTATIRCISESGEREGDMRDYVPRRVPVRTAGRIPKGLAVELARELSLMTVTLPVRAGDVLVKDWNKTGVAIIVTRDIG